MNAASGNVSAWAPFRHGAFALLWTATLISITGTWMHDVGAGWLMTTLDPTPAVVTLVQAATTLPIFLFALLAGTLADRVDKRRLLIVVNAILAVIIVVLALLVAGDIMTPSLLVLFTFLIGTGAAFVAPAWQSIVPSLVPRELLQPAVALNSMGINISRAIGPALAGFLITSVGIAAPFALNAISHVVIIAALLAWRPPARPAATLPPEPILGAMLTALRHAAFNGPLKATMARAVGFFVFASAYWALLPLVARELPGGGATLYGFLLAAIGAGAVIGALLLPHFRGRFSTDRLATFGVMLTALAMLVLGLARVPAAALVAAFAGGFGWIVVLTSLNVSAQLALPDWVRARGLAVYLMVFFGSLAAGSAGWGQLATATSVSTTLIVAAIGAVVAIPFTRGSKLGEGEDIDLSPSSHWPAPIVADELEGVVDRGPVMITIEYRIDAAQEHDFLAAMHALSGERYRDGARQWGIYEDTEAPGIWIEWFQLSSWAEHLRQHERATVHDQELHARARSFHRGDEPPRVRHWVAPQSQ
ncbi:MAG: MFS transporter [Pseudomonadota bacterium]